MTTTRLDCGLTLVIEPIPNVASAAVQWLIPAGAATDPPDGDGRAALLSELIFRGAGELDSRGHSDALDRLGVRRSSNASSHHIHLGAVVLGSQLEEALPLIVDMVRRPALPPDAIDAVRRLAIQSLDGLDDEPQQLVVLRVREQHLPPPFNRHGYGERSVLEHATIDELREHWRMRFVPGGSILGIAGAVDADRIAAQLNKQFSGWSGAAKEPREWAAAKRGRLYVPQETAQVHIALAYDAPAESEPTSMLERLATGVLSGGTSGRLFTEVRQKRSLCYSVGAAYRGGKERGMVSLYAGTTPERAQETLDVCLAEIDRLRSGAERDELDRAKTRLKSHLIMSGESTAARAAAIASDQHRIGRPRTLDEFAAAVDEITLDALNAYLESRSFGEFTVASIGPVELETSPLVAEPPWRAASRT